MCRLFNFFTVIEILCFMGWAVRVVAEEKTVTSAAAIKIVKAEAIFNDCSNCPKMVIVPAGHVVMGSPASEIGRKANESPMHEVNIASFALGKTEITRGQFAEFVKETGYIAGNKCWAINDGKYEERTGNWGNVGYAQTNDHPVVCVSWNDATAYTQWISLKTARKYRLPTEAEWEYAARGKISTARYWGEKPGDACKFANVADRTIQKQIKSAATWTVHNCTDGYAHSAPVGSFRANAFGLNDMLGNVWEWVEDSYHKNYQGAPVDASAWEGDRKKHVLRGGSWYDAPQYVRTSVRDKAVPVRRYDNFGFRIARNLP